MSLDLLALASQVRQMSQALIAYHDVQQLDEDLVLQQYREESINTESWAQAAMLSAATCHWILAEPCEPLDLTSTLPECPFDYAVLATDGSHIDLDHHDALPCALVNIGAVLLRYGTNPTALLRSWPTLFYEEEVLTTSAGSLRIPITGTYLIARRDVQEGTSLVAIANHDRPLPLATVALQDGTLLRWSLPSSDANLQGHFLDTYLTALDELAQRSIPVIAYISAPQATEIIGVTRLLFCPDVDVQAGRGAVCAVCSDIAAGRSPSCAVCDALLDVDLMRHQLQDRQRGPIFRSLAPLNQSVYGHHSVHFCYMHVGSEIARVEFPQWLAEQQPLLECCLAMIYDQCQKGQGYPVALARAHEQAVIQAADRRAFLRLLDRLSHQAGLRRRRSRKRISKIRPAV